jgi:BirA family transcriptional regulator, biotin operon repressor / biotin---[acetyl-CoA-carboxylase] ligase
LSHRTPKLIPLTGEPIGHQFIELARIDSTNNFAMAKVHAGEAAHGTVYFAHEQTMGKGQRGKSWSSSPGENIILSVVLAPPGKLPVHQFLLNMALAVAAFDFIHESIAENLAIKWPNDLYWRDSKLGGILIENLFRGKDLIGSVAGFGINVNQTHFDGKIPNPVSFKKITGLDYGLKELSKTLCGHIGKRYSALKNSDTKNILSEYNGRLFKKNERVSLKKEQKEFNTTIREVNLEGQLITEAPDGIYNHGEVEWIL